MQRRRVLLFSLFGIAAASSFFSTIKKIARVEPGTKLKWKILQLQQKRHIHAFLAWTTYTIASNCNKACSDYGRWSLCHKKSSVCWKQLEYIVRCGTHRERFKKERLISLFYLTYENREIIEGRNYWSRPLACSLYMRLRVTANGIEY